MNMFDFPSSFSPEEVFNRAFLQIVRDLGSEFAPVEVVLKEEAFLKLENYIRKQRLKYQMPTIKSDTIRVPTAVGWITLRRNIL